jgi:hypothetical protein
LIYRASVDDFLGVFLNLEYIGANPRGVHPLDWRYGYALNARFKMRVIAEGKSGNARSSNLIAFAHAAALRDKKRNLHSLIFLGVVVSHFGLSTPVFLFCDLRFARAQALCRNACGNDAATPTLGTISLHYS